MEKNSGSNFCFQCTKQLYSCWAIRTEKWRSCAIFGNICAIFRSSYALFLMLFFGGVGGQGRFFFHYLFCLVNEMGTRDARRGVITLQNAWLMRSYFIVVICIEFELQYFLVICCTFLLEVLPTAIWELERLGQAHTKQQTWQPLVVLFSRRCWWWCYPRCGHCTFPMGSKVLSSQLTIIEWFG